MNEEELLNLYLEKLRILALEHLSQEDISVVDALKASLTYIEGEMKGY